MEFNISHINAAVERLQKDLRQLEFEEDRLKRELEAVGEKKSQVLSELAKYSDERYEQDMLELVYQQRHQNRDKK